MPELFPFWRWRPNEQMGDEMHLPADTRAGSFSSSSSICPGFPAGVFYFVLFPGLAPSAADAAPDRQGDDKRDAGFNPSRCAAMVRSRASRRVTRGRDAAGGCRGPNGLMGDVQVRTGFCRWCDEMISNPHARAPEPKSAQGSPSPPSAHRGQTSRLRLPSRPAFSAASGWGRGSTPSSAQRA